MRAFGNRDAFRKAKKMPQLDRNRRPKLWILDGIMQSIVSESISFLLSQQMLQNMMRRETNIFPLRCIAANKLTRWQWQLHEKKCSLKTYLSFSNIDKLQGDQSQCQDRLITMHVSVAISGCLHHLSANDLLQQNTSNRLILVSCPKMPNLKIGNLKL
jgi:hypothetical protein